ncbi:MAG TPA: SDR family NAD(P)-dependent oxidoreductase [Microbacterium sp.]|uniref:SDR family NAD(P)-dependent oxidoreductase n=1 Tax=Microbacterium sp. TaxID=51671 RepID=UPI002B484FE5|nr:SDR family NAD(P)-dependent oxidoreductase [Microbacterium sp.]HKT58169.1 SDR family NAD(P)-dependent oxidoreductase [Microbacterium sp.]
MTGDLNGKIVIVTGAHGGQGDAEARLIAARGATVYAADIAEPEAAESAEVDAAPGSVQRVRLDVTSTVSWSTLVERVVARHGRIDALVNNAGIPFRARLGEVELADWDRVQTVNVTGALIGIQTAMPHLPPGSSIVNVGSVSALTGFHNVAYTVSKWALRGLSKVASTELGPRGIRVNAVHPGFIETPMTATSPPEFREANRVQVPLGRVGVPADVASVVAFLVSDESSYLSGVDIPVDGGQTAHGGALALARAIFGEES